MLHTAWSILGRLHLIALALIIAVLLLIFYFYKNHQSSRLQNENSKNENDFKDVENRYSQQRDNTQNRNGNSEEKIIVTKFESEGKDVKDVLEDLYGDEGNLDGPSIKKIFKKGKKLSGLFLVEQPKKRLVTRDLKYELISQRELKRKKKAIKSIDVSDIEIHGLLKDDSKLFVDGYDNVYLKTRNDIKKISSKNVKREEVISKAKRWIRRLEKKANLSLEVEDFYQDSESFTAKIKQKESDTLYRLIMGEDGTIQKYSKNGFFLENDQNGARSEYTELPFSHGIEVELQVVEDDWSWIDGKQMSIVFEQILDDVAEKIARARNDADPLVREKWKGITEIKEDNEGYEAVHVKYGKEDEKRYFSVLGKDSHVSLKTNILEIQTPPCKYLEELRWWAYNIYRVAHEVVEELDIEANLISLGINPVEKYSEGVSFGEHHHLGVEDEELRKKIYNLYRYLAPHLISLTANSPFSNRKTPNYTFNDRENLVITEPSYTMRLKRNVQQFRTPPYLPLNQGKEYFKEALGLDSDSVRMVDIYPFTRFGTIETRIFDTQLCTLDRISITVLLQTLALYVKRESNDIDIPDISSDRLKENRKQAIENGLLGKISRSQSDNHRDIFDTQENRYFYESWHEIIEKLWPYFTELGLEDSPAVKNLLMRLYSYEGISAEPPIAPAQLIVLRNLEENSNQEKLSSFLDYIKERSSGAVDDKMHGIWPEYINIGDVGRKEIVEFR